jgi:flagellar biosynthesis regulator FlaF
MVNTNHAIQAYRTASQYRPQRNREADVFRQVSTALKGAKGASPIQQIRALADNRVLWTTVGDLMRDPGNALPPALRASIFSVGLAVQREMDQKSPDFDFLISINEDIAAGLAGQP